MAEKPQKISFKRWQGTFQLPCQVDMPYLGCLSHKNIAFSHFGNVTGIYGWPGISLEMGEALGPD